MLYIWEKRQGLETASGEAHSWTNRQKKLCFDLLVSLAFKNKTGLVLARLPPYYAYLVPKQYYFANFESHDRKTNWSEVKPEA